jgi:short subunit dehydrogenase-like uncharacterized protein
MPKMRLMVYGAYGYTGRLIARRAAELGLELVLAGRDGAKLETVASELGLEARKVALDDPGTLAEALRDCAAVLHCAGPFTFTSAPMREACLATGTHYLDLTGEIPVIEACAGDDARARAAGIILMPSVGFDVVPTDCMAAMLHHRLPDATSLTLAFGGMDSLSRGTTRTAMLFLGDPVKVRRDGRIVPRRGAMSTVIDLGEGPQRLYAISWGDVASAFYTTGIPSIEVFVQPSAETSALLRLPLFAKRILASPLFARALRARLSAMPDGPDETARRTGRVLVYGRAENPRGEVVELRLRTCEGYALTALTATRLGQAVLEGRIEPGFQTPARAMGPEFILEFDGCAVLD